MHVSAAAEALIIIFDLSTLDTETGPVFSSTINLLEKETD